MATSAPVLDRPATTADSKSEGEVCAGCGAVAEAERVIEGDKVVTRPAVHPWVGIGAPDPTAGTTAEGQPGPDPAAMVAHPVCDACHRDPRHRTRSKLKVHFFPRAGRRLALLAAQAQIMRDNG